MSSQKVTATQDLVKYNDFYYYYYFFTLTIYISDFLLSVLTSSIFNNRHLPLIAYPYLGPFTPDRYHSHSHLYTDNGMKYPQRSQKSCSG